jgi:hypothetical protein
MALRAEVVMTHAPAAAIEEDQSVPPQVQIRSRNKNDVTDIYI